MLTIEIYKTRNGLNPSFLRQICEEKVLPYNLRCSDKLQLPKAKTTGLGIDTVKFVGKGGVCEPPPELKNQTPLIFSKAYFKPTNVMPATAELYKAFYPKLGFSS